MAKVLPLNDRKIKALKPLEKEYKVADGDGLYLHVMPNGSRLWRFRYTLNSKSSTISFGKYPLVSLSDARVKRDEARLQVIDGKKPTTKKQEQSTTLTFKGLIDEYFEHRSDAREKTVKDYRSKLNNHFQPLMKLELDDIQPLDIIKCIELMDKLSISETIRKSTSLLNRMFKYAVTKQKMKRNTMADIDVSVIVKKQKKRNFPHITDEDVFKQLIKMIDSYDGSLTIRMALKFMPYCFVRPSNIRNAKWEQFDFEKKLWIIPACEMKMEQDHIVPLTDSMIEILNNIKNNGSEYVFPSPYSKTRQIGEGTLNVALKRMGYADAMTTHGFRHSASTILNEHIEEHGVSRDIIDRQLGHTNSSSVEGVYNKAQYLKQRIKLIAWWSRYLDDAKA